MTHSELFVVRIWHQIEGRFRASVRRVDEEETRHFSRPDEVTRYLTTLTEADSGRSRDFSANADRTEQ